MKKLAVWYEGWGERWQLGTLAHHERSLLFEYSPAAIASGLELSPIHLPLRIAAYTQFPAYFHGLPGLIADALPDGWGMLLQDRLLRRFGRDPATVSPLERLSLLGANAIGAFSFEPADAMAGESATSNLRELAEASRHILAGRDSQALAELARLGGSPHGARPKVLVQYDAAARIVSTDDRDAGCPWLVKFPARGEHVEVAALEGLYAELARRAGLNVPATQAFDLGPKLAAFGTARFDRAATQIGWVRVPVQSLAAAIHADHRLPSADYTTLLQVTRLMARDERAVAEAFARAVFNVVFHNRDDQAKNFSFALDAERRWCLAPAFDLTYSHGPGGEHSMAVHGEARSPSRQHLLALAKQSGVAVAVASQTIERITGLAESFAKTASDWPIRRTTISQVTKAIRANCARMRG